MVRVSRSWTPRTQLRKLERLAWSREPTPARWLGKPLTVTMIDERETWLLKHIEALVAATNRFTDYNIPMREESGE